MDNQPTSVHGRLGATRQVRRGGLLCGPPPFESRSVNRGSRTPEEAARTSQWVLQGELRVTRLVGPPVGSRRSPGRLGPEPRGPRFSRCPPRCPGRGPVAGPRRSSRARPAGARRRPEAPNRPSPTRRTAAITRRACFRAPRVHRHWAVGPGAPTVAVGQTCPTSRWYRASSEDRPAEDPRVHGDPVPGFGRYPVGHHHELARSGGHAERHQEVRAVHVAPVPTPIVEWS